MKDKQSVFVDVVEYADARTEHIQNPIVRMVAAAGIVCDTLRIPRNTNLLDPQAYKQSEYWKKKEAKL